VKRKMLIAVACLVAPPAARYAFFAGDAEKRTLASRKWKGLAKGDVGSGPARGSRCVRRRARWRAT
jgi:hypothetical protein